MKVASRVTMGTKFNGGTFKRSRSEFTDDVLPLWDEGRLGEYGERLWEYICDIRDALYLQ